MTIYLVRHATPDWSRKDLAYHLPPGPPLTDVGLDEARQAGLYLRQAGVRWLYSSPLERCLHTAQIVSGLSGAPLSMHPELIEGQPGEGRPQMRSRMRAVFEQACQEQGASALFSHGGPIGALLEELGMPDQELSGWQRYDHNNPVPPAGIWEASREGDRDGWQLRLVFAPQPGRPLQA